MHRADEKRRISGTHCRLLAVVVAAVVAAAANGSCLFRTETNLCDKFERRCPRGQTCALHQDACIEIDGCGDGFADPVRGEVCDDGNITDGDGCSADCKSDETCGNHIIDRAVGESCEDEDGNTVSGDGCDSHCVAEVCGDQLVNIEVGEVCDDGNQISGDGCSANCRSNEACGNGHVDQGGALPEQCDPVKTFPLPAQDTPECNHDCTMATCSDGHLNRLHPTRSAVPGQPDHLEQCDDGDGHPRDSIGCNRDCSFARCGDGYENSAALEECDNGVNNSDILPNMCRTDCRRAHCGDFVKDGGEDCDTRVDTPQCDSGDCTMPSCGDGYRNRAAGEECDPGSPSKPPVVCDDPTELCTSSGSNECKCM